MPHSDCFIVMVMGGIFILLGLITIILGKHEEESFYDSLSTRTDVREYLEHMPEHPEPGALRIGGWIAIGIGLLMVAMGGGFWLWG